MGYTHFKLVEFGERTVAKADGIPVLINTWYPKEQILSFDKLTNGTVGEPYDKVKYMVTDGTVNSNTANIIISFPPSKLITPVASNGVVSAVQNTLYDVMNGIVYNNAVDRIKIISFNSNGELTFEGSQIYPNFIVMQYDFNQLQFKTLNGLGDAYQSIKYQAGNANGYNPDIYQIDFNLTGEATLKNFSNSLETIEGISYYYGLLEIENGIPFATAKVSVITTLGAALWYPLTENKVWINEVPESQNGSRDVYVILDANGKGNINYLLEVLETDLPVTGTIDFSLVTMNNSIDFVSLTEYQVIENINI